MSKFPSGGKIYENAFVFLFILDVLKLWWFVLDCLGFGGPKWSAPHHHPPPSPASMSKFPSGGKDMERNGLLMIFDDFYKKEKRKHCIKMVLKWLRRVAFVGWDMLVSSIYSFKCFWTVNSMAQSMCTSSASVTGIGRCRDKGPKSRNTWYYNGGSP